MQRHERFNLARHKKSKELTQDPYLHDLVQAKLTSLRDIGSHEEDIDLDSISIKELRYALIGILAIDIVQGAHLDTQPLPEHVKSKGERYSKLISEPEDGWARLKERIESKYGDRWIKYFYSNQDSLIIKDLKDLEIYKKGYAISEIDDEIDEMFGNIVWQQIYAGIGTSAIFMTYLLKTIMDSEAAKNLAREDLIREIRRSYNLVTEVASQDPLRLDPINLEVQTGGYTAVKTEHSPFKLSPNLLDAVVSQAVKKILDESKTPEITGKEVTVKDYTKNEDVLGCPFLFTPGQVKQVWNETVDMAIQMKLV